MTSTRIAVAAALLVGLALIPTARHSYLEDKADDGYSTAGIASRLGGMASQPTDRQAAWVKKTLDSDDWIERHYEKPGGGTLTLFVSRSYDLKRLYHHPELAVAYGTDLREGGIETVASLSGVPLHILRGDADAGAGVGLAAYALSYGDQFVADPYRFQLQLAGQLVFTARKPMTLFFVLDPTASAKAPVATEPLTRLLAAAIDSFRTQTRSPAVTLASSEQ
jgi:hypothetical protein